MMRPILLALVVLGGCFLIAPVADACIEPTCSGLDCHVRTTTIASPTGDEITVPTGYDCYY
jgi:hypothetical protein